MAFLVIITEWLYTFRSPSSDWQSVLGMALNTGTDLLGEIDGSKADAASRCYYAAAVMLWICDLLLIVLSVKVYSFFFVASVAAVMFGGGGDLRPRRLEM